MPHSRASGDTHAAFLARLAREAEHEARQRILPFWLALRDEPRGGFFGVATSRGRPLPSADKGAVLHGRILWFLSTAHQRWPEPGLKAAADAAYAFIRDRLIDPEHGGVFWTVSAEGAPADARKHLYAQAFAIYGLAAFHAAFASPEAKALAFELWSLVEARAAEAGGGYSEAFSRDWRTAPNELMGRADAPKTFNAHFHWLEALDALFTVAPDELLRTRLADLLQRLMAVAFDRRRATFRQFFDASWRPLDAGLSYGHDVEASWLLPAVARRLGLGGLEPALAGVAGAVLHRAVDAEGGVRSGRGADGGRDPSRIWWVQAEALVGFLDAYERKGEARFLAATEALWRFIQAAFFDREGGEWRERPEHATASRAPRPKAHMWKGPYHNGRACLEVSDRAARLAGATAPMR